MGIKVVHCTTLEGIIYMVFTHVDSETKVLELNASWKTLYMLLIFCVLQFTLVKWE